MVGDADRLHQVVANLLANARAHTPAGTTVTIATVRPGRDRAGVECPTTGPASRPSCCRGCSSGSPAATARSRAAGSTGLGLAIVSAVADAHGGTGRGGERAGDTTFAVLLPAT